MNNNKLYPLLYGAKNICCGRASLIASNIYEPRSLTDALSETSAIANGLTNPYGLLVSSVMAYSYKNLQCKQTYAKVSWLTIFVLKNKFSFITYFIYNPISMVPISVNVANSATASVVKNNGKA